MPAVQAQQQLLRALEARRQLERAQHLAARRRGVARLDQGEGELVQGLRPVHGVEGDQRPARAHHLRAVAQARVERGQPLVEAGLERPDVERALEGGGRARRVPLLLARLASSRFAW